MTTTTTHPERDLPIKVAAYIRPGREDESARARFANGDRAEQYARLLANGGTYAEVVLWDQGGTAWVVPADVLVNSDGEEVG